MQIGFPVTARFRIQQNPLSPAPAVPRGACGHIEDEADGFAWVDFGGAYGVVCCDIRELKGGR